MVQFSESLTKRIIISLSSPLDKRDDTYIVTPRRRLARQIKEEFNNSMQGKLSYSPQIMTLGDWIIFHGEALLAKEQILLMGSLQAQLIWGEALSRVKKEDILEELTTWDIGREAGATNTADAMRQKLIVQAQDAWRKIHLYQLELNSRVFAKDKITHFFYEWSNAYQEICEQRKLCDEFMLTDKLLAAIATKEVGIKRSLWVGFTDNYPVYERLYELIRKQGGGLIDKVDAFRIKSESEGKVQVPQLMMEEYENDQDELLDLAQKVKLFAQENPESQVGVVIPGLEKNWHKVRQSFAHALLEERDTSNYSAEELLDELDLPFDMSWGEELQEFPLIGSLLDLLRLNQERTSPAELLDRFNSPYLAGHKEEIIARTRLNSKLCLMSVTYRAISLADIAAKSPLLTAKPGSAANLLTEVPRLRTCLNEYFTVEGAFAQAANPRHWAKIIGQQVHALGWGDIKWSHLERQLWDKLLAMLDGLYEAGNIIETMSREEAISFMSQESSQIFQPSPAPAKIKLLGISEASGLMFDQLFVARMDTTCIPQEQINFFIPFALAQAANILGRDCHRDKEQIILEGLKKSAPMVNFSYAQVVGDEDRLPHPLLDNLLSKEERLDESSKSEDKGEDKGISKKLGISIPLEILHDVQAPAVEDKEPLNNLVGIIKSHSSCPFQSLMAHRVGPARMRQSQEEMSQQERGTMLHKILRDLWDKLEDKKSLDNLLPKVVDKNADKNYSKELDKVIANSVTKALEENRVVFLKDDLTFELEEQLLLELTKTLALFEKGRWKDFAVAATEQKNQLVMGGRKFDLKMDRIDHLIDEDDPNEGTHILIDYKLSNTKYIAAHMQGDRPKEPQLIIYSLLDDKLRSLGFITLQPKDKNTCIASGLGLAEDGMFYDKKNHTNEMGLKDMQINVKRIYDSFISGNSQVDPRDSTSCRECDFASVCRIKESMTTQISGQIQNQLEVQVNV